MPICRHCSAEFEGPYRQRYCTLRCQLLSKVPAGLPSTICWEWKGGTVKGYGVMNIRGKVTYAHRVAYEQFVGEIPLGYGVFHRCDNPGCVNHAHLFVGPQSENVADMNVKGRGDTSAARAALKTKFADPTWVRTKYEKTAASLRRGRRSS
jgi:hypothetical protein